MTDTDKLKRLAEDLRFKGGFAAETEREAAIRRNERNDRAADAILALIAENERLKDTASVLAMKQGECRAERDEAVALLRDTDEYTPVSLCGRIDSFLARIDVDDNNVP